MKVVGCFFGFLLLLALNCEAMNNKTELFEQYLRVLQKMRSMHPNQLAQLTESRLYRHLDFATNSKEEYLRRKNYRDVDLYINKSGIKFTREQALIEEWKDNCQGMKWKENICELHHIIPRGYGGENVWWNIFPLTFNNHRKKGQGIHSNIIYKALFPKVVGKEQQ